MVFCRLTVFGIPLLPLPRGQCPGELLASGARQCLTLQGIVLLRLFLLEDFADALLVACLCHGAMSLLAIAWYWYEPC